ncbi:MAG: glycosyltransferase [bacterium]|nr:glycosyltransferase [bacterium]
MHILLLIDKLLKAGTQRQVELLATGLVEAGRQVTIFLLEQHEDRPLPNLPGVKIVRTPVGPLNRLGSLKESRRLVEMIRREAPDVVHTFLFKANVLGALAGRLAGVPVIVGSRRSLGYDLTRRGALALRVTQRFTDAIVANTPAVLSASARIEGAPHPLGQVIPNGVVDEGVTIVGPGKARLGVLANIRPVKGHDIVLQAFRMILEKHSAASLHLMGDRTADPAWVRQLEAIVEDLKIADKVYWYPADTPRGDFFSRIDVLALPSRSEGLSNALLEGMSAGLAIVASEVGASRAVLEGVGSLVPAGEPAALAAAVERYFSDHPLKTSHGRAARFRALSRYTVSAMVDAHLQLYRNLRRTASDRRNLLAPTPRRGLLFAIDELDSGGTERQLEHWIAGLRRSNLPISVVCLRSGGETADRLAASGVPIHYLGKRYPLDIGFLWRQQRLLRRLRPAAVLALLATAGLWTVPAARFSGTPRVLFSARGTALTNETGRRGPVRLLSLALRLAHRVLVNSGEVSRFCRRILSVPETRIAELPNAVDVGDLTDRSRRSVRRELGLPLHAPLFGIVGRLTEVKNHEMFLTVAEGVCAQIRNAEALVVGGGERSAWLREEIRGRNLTNKVIPLGHRPDALKLIRALDVLLLTSHSEGSPNVILEARAVGTPVVGVTVGGVAELLAGGAGHKVPPGDVDAMMAATLTALTTSHSVETSGGATSPGRHDPVAVTATLCSHLLPDTIWWGTVVRPFQQGDPHVSIQL